MNLFKKSTATVALVALVSGIFSTGVSAYSTAEVEAANALAEAGVIVNHSADPAGYNLDQNVLRQEIAAVARGVAGLPKATEYEAMFSDVTETTPNDWAWASVNVLAENDLIAANDTFRPEANITKAEAIGMMVKASFGDEYTYDAESEASWQEQVVEFASMNGVVSSFTNYNTLATRGFVFEAGVNAMDSSTVEDEDDILEDLLEDLLNEDEDDSSNDDDSNNDDDSSNDDDSVTDLEAEVEVTLNPTSNDSQTVPNSGLVTFGKFDFTAGSEDVSVDSVMLERQGLSDRTDISRVYFEQNSKRVSSRASVNIDNEINVSFTPALVIEAGTTETLDLVVELDEDSDVGAEHRFALTDVEASTSVANNLPVVTNTMRLGSYTVEPVTFDPTIAGGTPELNVGDDDVLIGEFQLETTGDRDNLFKSVTFTNNGGADLDNVLANVGLYNNGEEISTEVMIEGRDITFIVNGEIENGRTENYEIRADIVALERLDDTIQLELRNNTDLNVVEVRTSFSAPINENGTVMEEYTLVGGELLLTRDSEYTNSSTVSSSTNDVVLLSSNLRVDEAITVEDLTMDYTATVSDLVDQYRDLRLVVDGRTVSTYTPSSTDTLTGSIDFDGTFLVQSDSNIQVLGNLKNDVTDNSTFEIDGFSLISYDEVDSSNETAGDIRYISNDERVDTIPGTVQGIKITVAEASLLVTRNDGLNSESLVSGAKDVELFGFSMRANDVADIKVTSLRPDASYTGTGFDVSNVTNVRLYQGNTLLKTENDFDFNSLNVTIDKNSAKSFRIVADFDNSVVNGSTLTLSLDDSSEVSARNVQSNKLLGNASINGVDSTLFTFQGEGSVEVTTNSSSRDASVVTPSSSETDVFTFDLEARDDDLRLTDLYVTQSGTTLGTGATLELTNAVRSSSIRVNGRVIEGAVVSDNTLYFPIGTANPIILERDEVTSVDVNLAFNDSNTRTNEAFQLTIGEGDYTGAVNGTVNGLRLVSDSTGLELDDTSFSGVESEQHLLARSKPTVARLSESTSSTAYKFSVTADSNRKIDLEELTFNIRGISQTGATLDLRKEGSNNVIATSTGETLEISGTDVTFSTLDGDDEVASGTTTTYVLEVSGIDTGDNVDRTREVTLTDLVYEDDVLSGNEEPISVAPYNVLPTTATTYQY